MKTLSDSILSIIPWQDLPIGIGIQHYGDSRRLLANSLREGMTLVVSSGDAVGWLSHATGWRGATPAVQLDLTDPLTMDWLRSEALRHAERRGYDLRFDVLDLEKASWVDITDRESGAPVVRINGDGGAEALVNTLGWLSLDVREVLL